MKIEMYLSPPMWAIAFGVSLFANPGLSKLGLVKGGAAHLAVAVGAHLCSRIGARWGCGLPKKRFFERLAVAQQYGDRHGTTFINFETSRTIHTPNPGIKDTNNRIGRMFLGGLAGAAIGFLVASYGMNMARPALEKIWPKGNVKPIEEKHPAAPVEQGKIQLPPGLRLG